MEEVCRVTTSDVLFTLGTGVLGAGIVLVGRWWLGRDRTPEPFTAAELAIRAARRQNELEANNPQNIAARARMWEAEQELKRQREELAHRRAVELAIAEGRTPPPPLPPRNIPPATK